MEKTINRLIEIRNIKSELSKEENLLLVPTLEDISKIDDIYDVFKGYVEDNNQEFDTTRRQQFLFVVVFLYSVGTLAGGKMKVGLRDKISEVTGCGKTLISHNCINLLFQYTHYKEFKDGVDELMRRVSERISLERPNLYGGCHSKGYLIRMADGSSKAVENIAVGDFVMGDDGTPREVESVHSGHGRLIRIRPSKGEAFFVNECHVLPLYSKRRGVGLEITAMSYFHQTSKNKRDLMLVTEGKELVRFEAFRTRKTEDYFGFSLGGNHLYVDSQGFIHHNDNEE